MRLEVESHDHTESTFQGLDRACYFVIPSYSWALDRMKGVDSGLPELTVYATTLTLACRRRRSWLVSHEELLAIEPS